MISRNLDTEILRYLDIDNLINMLWGNININLKTTNMELTEAINDYVTKRVTNLGKLLKKIKESGGEVMVYFEVTKTTNHHKGGLIYRANCNITVDGNQFYSQSEKEDLYEAIDDCKDQLFNNIKKKKEKKQAFFKKGATKLKSFIRSAQFWK